ncbi:Pro-rich N-terminal domain-containing protein [Streptomyces sp. NPDC012751]|uniref:Pro-rich N-terminal domain-containing protein n=1 Tax=Streptomyces sp. NPDC012751 TaxID=3364846 RepID=UPI003698D006
MQHAVGSPLPPPHQPGQGPHAGWATAAHQPGPHPAASQGPVPVPPPPGFPAPAGPVPPAPQQPPAPSGPVPHSQQSPVPSGPVPQPQPQPQQPPAPSGPVPHPQQPPAASGRVPHPQHRPGPPAADTTGHVPLPPGAPVGAPAAPPAAVTVADPAATPLAVLLIGPAGAGKTSVAKYWADRRRVPTAHISLDDVREWVRSGFADPQSGWNDHSEAQYRLARRTCGFAARNFLANGISCILDDAVFPDRPVVGLGGWKRHVGPGLLPVVLLPGLDVVLERNAERTGNRRLTDEEVARIHGRMAGWYGSGLPIIDNSQLDVPGTARVLDEVLARAMASPPSW